MGFGTIFYNPESDLDTLLARLTSARAGYLDLLNTYLDAKVSTRLPTASYYDPEADLGTLLDRLTSTRAGYIDYIANATYGLEKLLRTAHFDLADLSEEYVIPVATPQSFNDANANDLTELEVTGVAIPSGATVTKELLYMILEVMATEDPGAVNKIDFEVYAKKSGGAYGTAKWSEDDVLSLPDLNGARDALPIVADVTGLLDSEVTTYNFKGTIQASLAKSVQYMYSGIYLIRYKMG
jgi:hypothetical protein